MATLLVITASPRGDRSVTRALATLFTDLWAEQHPEDTILLRDVGHHPVPHVTEPWVVGAYAPPDSQTPETKAAIAVSDLLVEFVSADRYVFSVPMYNFNVPSTFKAYIDQIVRPGRTFGVGPNGFEGLVKDRKALIIAASGGAYAPGSPFAAMDFHGPYLRAVFSFIGLTDVEYLTADNVNRGEDAARQSKERAENALRDLVPRW
ncbi:MAG: FMN-dependent NADH-azoreductase [Verrucomicrobiota bacterium]